MSLKECRSWIGIFNVSYEANQMLEGPFLQWGSSLSVTIKSLSLVYRRVVLDFIRTATGLRAKV